MLINNQKNNVNFTSTRVHYLNLKKVVNGVDCGVERAVFSKLDLKKDKEAIEKLKNASAKENLIFKLCCTNFLNPLPGREKYYAIERLSGENLDKRIVGLIEAYPKKNGLFELSLLATKSEFSKDNPTRTLKNIGLGLLNSIFKTAKNINSSAIQFKSANDKFYINNLDLAKTKYTLDKKQVLEIKREEFDNFLSFFNNKFSLSKFKPIA